MSIADGQHREVETYRIIRFCFDSEDPRHREVIETGLTLYEAQRHCSLGDTRGDDWFDGYEKETA